MSERKNGEAKNAEKGKKSYLWHKAANSSKGKKKKQPHTPHKQTHLHKASLLFSYHLSRSAAVKPCTVDMSQKSISSSRAKIKSFALYYTHFQLQFHCSKNDR